MKRTKKIMLVAIMLLLLFPVTVSAAVGNKYKTGAVLPDYEKVVTVNIDPGNFDRSFMAALAEARERADHTTQYKIVIPPGTYTVGHQYSVPGNTCIYAKGAEVQAEGTRTIVLRGPSDRASENIMIEGGIWSTLRQQNCVSNGAPFRFMGVKNLVLKDMDIRTNRMGHIIEVADIYGMTIQGCKISGNNMDSQNPYKGVQPKEAIQLDVATPAAMPAGFESNMYNGKGCHKVLIRNNTFVNCARGVGSHSEKKGAEKKPYTHITVTKNVFKNLLGEAIHAQDWRDSTISYNTVTKGRQAGIFVCDSRNIRVNKNKITDIRRYTGTRKNAYDPKGLYGNGILVRISQKLYIDNNRIHKVYKAGVVQEFSSKNKVKKNKTTGVRK